MEMPRALRGEPASDLRGECEEFTQDAPAGGVSDDRLPGLVVGGRIVAYREHGPEDRSANEEQDADAKGEGQRRQVTEGLGVEEERAVTVQRALAHGPRGQRPRALSDEAQGKLPLGSQQQECEEGRAGREGEREKGLHWLVDRKEPSSDHGHQEGVEENGA